ARPERPGRVRAEPSVEPARHPTAQALHGCLDIAVGQPAAHQQDQDENRDQEELHRHEVLIPRPRHAVIDLDQHGVQQVHRVADSPSQARARGTFLCRHSMATAKVSPANSSELNALRMATKLSACGESCHCTATRMKPNTRTVTYSARRQGNWPASARYSIVPVNISAKMVKVSQGATKPLLKTMTSSPVTAASTAPTMRVRPRPASVSTRPTRTRLSVIATATPGVNRS